MQSYQVLQWVAAINGLVFVFAFGAIVGSFLNVLAHRLPRGEGIVRPPSACPACGTRLRWCDNIPIFGWILLRGRCRYCRSRISVAYPLVELLTAVLFAVPFAVWFMDPTPVELLGVDPAFWSPAWTDAGFGRTWPLLLLVHLMLAVLIAVTLIDAKTFMIPLSLPWLLAGAAIAVHTGLAAWSEYRLGVALPAPPVAPPGLPADAFDGLPAGAGWMIPLAEGPWLGLALGGTAGLLCSALLLTKGWLPRSFADYDQWELEAQARAQDRPESGSGTAAPIAPGDAAAADPPQEPARHAVVRALVVTSPALAGMFMGFAIGAPGGVAPAGAGIGAALGLVIGLVLRSIVTRSDRVTEGGGGGGGQADPIWVGYPHARREMLKEMLFLLPPAALGALGLWLCLPGGPLGGVSADPGLTPAVLGGSLLGMLVGGGLVWAVRILGTLAFGKEAMGLGDVHLMAGVGAAVGWIDPTLAFFVAPFLGIAWAVGSTFLGSVLKREGTALPYGPHLAAATVLIVLLKPLAEIGLTALTGGPVDLP